MSGATSGDSTVPLIDIFNGSSTPSSTEPTLPLPPPLPEEFSTLPPGGEALGNSIAPPPLPDLSEDMNSQPVASTLPPQPVTNDPAQFKIPN